MNKRVLKFGIWIGLIGGGLMALFAMTAMKLLGHGFLTPVNLFAHTFWADAPLNGSFTVASFELGLAIHLAISIAIGITLAFIVETGQLDTGTVFFLALGVGACAWIVQSFAWTAVDSDAHAAFTPWVLAVAHVVFALGAAWFLNRLEARAAQDESPVPAEASPALRETYRNAVTLQ